MSVFELERRVKVVMDDPLVSDSLKRALSLLAFEHAALVGSFCACMLFVVAFIVLSGCAQLKMEAKIKELECKIDFIACKVDFIEVKFNTEKMIKSVDKMQRFVDSVKTQ